MRQDAWGEAEAASYREGFPFNDRNGIRRNEDNEQVGVVTLSVQCMLARLRLDYNAMGWDHVVR